MNRRNFLGFSSLAALIPMVSFAGAKTRMPRIRVLHFREREVTLAFPNESVRVAFWKAFTDFAWPEREGRTAELFKEVYGPIFSGDGPWGELVCPLGRRQYFDQYALQTAAKLYEQGIILEVIKDDVVVTPQFKTVTTTLAYV